MENNAPKKIYVAMSGGVDSSVTAAILQRQGFDVTGIYMKNWSGDDYGLQSECPWEQDQRDAEAVCAKLNLPFRSFNFEKEYRERVVNYFFSEFRAGRTPNPDIMCNKEIKFGLFLDKALSLGADLIATGHYARVSKNARGEYELRQGIDTNKDQSYFLCELDQQQLSRTLFPVGGLTKSEVRKLAQEFQLPVADKPDSQGICFVGEINVAAYLRAHIKVHTGDIMDADTGKIVGRHDGVEFYTIGQREGLKIGGAALPYFVSDKDLQQNLLFVAQGKDNPRLFKDRVNFGMIHWINSLDQFVPDTGDKLALSAAIRYRQKPEPGELDLSQNSFHFDKPQRAVTPGQIIAFYQGEILRGSAVIIKEEPESV